MTENQYKLASLAPKITEDGKPITFAEYLSETSFDGSLFTDEIAEMLEAALEPGTEWNEVDDLIGPIAKELVGYAVENDFNVYIELVKAIKTAREKLMLKDALDGIEICLDPTDSVEEYNKSLEAVSDLLSKGLHITEVITYGHGTAQRFRFNYPGEESNN